MKTMLNVALPKGRLGEKVYKMFEAAGYGCEDIFNGRKLVFENKDAGVRYFWVKPSDVAIYVERGAADIGVAGKDILLEYEPDVFELLDLNLGKCRMAVAAKKDFHDDGSRTLTTQELLHMSWLCENVEGAIPEFDQLLPISQPTVRELGIYRDTIPADKEGGKHEDIDRIR